MPDEIEECIKTLDDSTDVRAQRFFELAAGRKALPRVADGREGAGLLALNNDVLLPFSEFREDRCKAVVQDAAQKLLRCDRADAVISQLIIAVGAIEYGGFDKGNVTAAFLVKRLSEAIERNKADREQELVLNPDCEARRFPASTAKFNEALSSLRMSPCERTAFDVLHGLRIDRARDVVAWLCALPEMPGINGLNYGELARLATGLIDDRSKLLGALKLLTSWLPRDSSNEVGRGIDSVFKRSKPLPAGVLAIALGVGRNKFTKDLKAGMYGAEKQSARKWTICIDPSNVKNDRIRKQVFGDAVQ